MKKAFSHVFDRLAEGQGVMASSWYAMDAREVSSLADALDVGPEGQEPAVFWIFDKAALKTAQRRLEAAKLEALRREPLERKGWSPFEVEIDGFLFSVTDSWGDKSVSCRRGSPDWTDYIIEEARAS